MGYGILSRSEAGLGFRHRGWPISVWVPFAPPWKLKFQLLSEMFVEGVGCFCGSLKYAEKRKKLCDTKLLASSTSKAVGFVPVMPTESMSLRDMLFWFFITLFGTGTFVIYGSQSTTGEICGVAMIVVGFTGMTVCAWPQLKDPISGNLRLTRSAVQRIVHYPLYRTAAKRLVLGYILIYCVLYARQLRTDLDTYVMPRNVTKKQVERLREYLSKQTPSTISVRVVLNDGEAMEYAGQLFNAMRRTNWEATRIEYLKIPNAHRPAPTPTDVDAQGKRLYKDNEEFLKAYSAWIEMDITNKLDEHAWGEEGLCIQTEFAGQPPSPDPRKTTPEQVLKDALTYAGIEVNCGGGSPDRGKDVLILFVGHRPRILGDTEPLLTRIGEWLQRLGND